MPFAFQLVAAGVGDVRPPSMLGTDPPEHTRLRSLVSKAFTPRIVQRLEGRMAEIIGIPAEHREQFKRWSDEAVANLGVAFMSGIDPERARRQLALLDEMLSMLVLLLVAGNETTTTLIGNAVQELAAHPDAERRVRADPSLLPRAIEEVLRFASPVQFAPRRARRALELHGVELREDDVLLCWLGSANRDESVFPDPERFDLTRDPNPHLAFGFGIHYCVGANLARLEARVALEALLRRTRSIELADEGELPLHPSPVFRAVTRLPVRLEPA